MKEAKRIISEILASIAIILLAIYLIDVFSSTITSQHGFLPLTSKDRGIIFGGVSISLFVISYLVSIKIPSKYLSILLTIGGAVIGTAVLTSTFITPQFINSFEGIKVVTPPLPQFAAIIIIGYIIMGLGIFRLIRK